MAQNFLACDRDQELLLPPSLREWLPEDRLAWFVLDSVAELDLDGFYSAYRADGWGAAAHGLAVLAGEVRQLLGDGHQEQAQVAGAAGQVV